MPGQELPPASDLLEQELQAGANGGQGPRDIQR